MTNMSGNFSFSLNIFENKQNEDRHGCMDIRIRAKELLNDLTQQVKPVSPVGVRHPPIHVTIHLDISQPEALKGTLVCECFKSDGPLPMN